MSTKDQRQTKPLVVSERVNAAEAQAGPSALGSALISISRLPPLPVLAAIRRITTLFSSALEQPLRGPEFENCLCCVNLFGFSQALTWTLAGTVPNLR